MATNAQNASQNHNHIVVNLDVLTTVWSVFFQAESIIFGFIYISQFIISFGLQHSTNTFMLELEFFGQHFGLKMISFVAVVTETYLLAHVLRFLEIFLDWLQIDYLNGFQLFVISNTLILHSTMQLYQF